ncbi:TPA: hypothetical protein N0F65_012729 [Lagenidium giganteum]|uniref:Transmembrane protein n=1 Tax=Lagenidium giganteum TaxID=4803 RepID=A0AAV2YGM3_9STRA|nr:TPA: hypothetical protein N0F65_012729 [Lagenidium giganteum]
MMMMRALGTTLAFAAGLVAVAVAETSDPYNDKWNQSSRFSIEVSTKDWSNYDPENGGCVTCPYTCVKPKTGPTGTSLNLSNASLMADLPTVYTQPIMNGCCYADKGKSKVMPDCSNKANPPSAEPCGFLYGPTLEWRIDDAQEVFDKPYRAILFASVDCTNFWAVAQTAIKYTSPDYASVKGSKQMNGGCYGEPTGVPMVLAGCITSELKFDKSKNYPWDKLALKCSGLSGKCVITNGIWGEHLKCCTKDSGLTADWDISYKKYTAKPKTSVHLSGPAITLIVFGGVGLIMCLVHFGGKVRERAKQTALMREQEATDDYEEIMTPLTGAAGGEKKPVPLQRPIGPSSVEVSLHEGDMIFTKPKDEVLYEGDMY